MAPPVTNSGVGVVTYVIERGPQSELGSPAMLPGPGSTAWYQQVGLSKDHEKV